MMLKKGCIKMLASLGLDVSYGARFGQSFNGSPEIVLLLAPQMRDMTYPPLAMAACSAQGILPHAAAQASNQRGGKSGGDRKAKARSF
eukprot:5417586-Amphidinium_carterae.1